MNLRETVVRLEQLRLEKCDWKIRVRGSGCEQLQADIRRAAAAREAYLRMAEAAMAYAEYQYDTGHGVLVEMGDYIGRRDRLWKEFVVARDKAINQQ